MEHLTTYLHTGHLHDPRSQYICKYDSRSKHCTCLHSCPRAGSVILLNVMGHLSETLRDVCSTASLSLSAKLDVGLLKFFLILATHNSGPSSRFFRRPWRTDRTLGLCTNCSTKRWLCKYGNKLTIGLLKISFLTS